MTNRKTINGIPYIEYSSILECISDNSVETKKYLSNYKLDKLKYDNEFSFIFKIKWMKNYFIVVNCFSTSFNVEILSLFDSFENENELFNKGICKSSYNLKKAISILKTIKNRYELTKRKFWYLVRLFTKSYKKVIRIYNYDYAHINNILKDLQNDKSVNGYYWIKKECN